MYNDFENDRFEDDGLENSENSYTAPSVPSANDGYTPEPEQPIYAQEPEQVLHTPESEQVFHTQEPESQETVYQHEQSANIWDTPQQSVPNPQPVQPQRTYGAGASFTEPVYTRPVGMNNAYSPNHYGSINSTSRSSAAGKNKKSGSGKKWAKRVVGLVAAAAICAGASAGAATVATNARIKKAIDNGEFSSNQVVVNTAQSSTPSVSTDNVSNTKTGTGKNMSVSEIYDMACQQVVGINITGTTTTTNFFGGTSQFAVSGSGFIVSEDGYIVTNAHVIEYGLQGYDVNVMLQDGTTYTAKIVGYEKDSDVAVLKIDATGLNAVTIGSSDELYVGENVYCVGNPLGELAYSISDGIVSAKDRLISTEEAMDINMFQLTAAVNHGNSGGPVYNDKGEVVGIVTAKYSDSDAEGLGFAIPIDDAMAIVKDLIENGYVTGKAYMGVTVQTVDQTAIQYYNLVAGACVTSVSEGSAAEKAGLKIGDIITALGDTEITSGDELRSARRAYRAGDSAELTVYRNGESITLTIVFDEEPRTDETQQQQQQQPQTQNPNGDGGESDDGNDSWSWDFELPEQFKDLFPSSNR
ncbi:MAG: trypsin-like peptidase domain-containing protein [Oscillospiraceae bacterium]|nr:trypsin-like peptidase domain-containing protein [Oscillospiraceae bacterium]